MVRKAVPKIENDHGTIRWLLIGPWGRRNVEKPTLPALPTKVFTTKLEIVSHKKYIPMGSVGSVNIHYVPDQCVKRKAEMNLIVHQTSRTQIRVPGTVVRTM